MSDSTEVKPEVKAEVQPKISKEEQKKQEAIEKEQILKGKTVDVTVQQIEKEFGVGSIMKLGDSKKVTDIPAISTKAITLDIALGIGGVPRGRIVEIYGPESSGKTTLALSTVACAQRKGGLAAFIDVEHALDPQYAKKIGVNVDELLVSQPDSGEDALSICEMLVKSNSVDIVVVDSVAALVPRAEIEGNMGDTHVGLQARLMSQALRKLTSIVARSNTCCIFINQIREKIGVMFGSPETTPGGRALKFYSSVRMDVRRIGAIKDLQGVVVGSRVRTKVVKNKVAPPFTEGEFDIYYDEGISESSNILDVAVTQGIVDKKGSWFSYGEERLGQGKEASRLNLKGNDKLRNEILAKVREKIGF